ncbi:hypothetical protein ACFL6S_00875 [Candidatus Poribacteria bacterium]
MDIRAFGWAFLLGIIFVFAPTLVGRYAGPVVTDLTSVCLVLVLTYLFVLGLRRRHRDERLHGYRRDMAFVGLLWLVMSLVAELIRQYTMRDTMGGLSWEDYNILKGRLMGLVLLSELVTPYVLGVFILRHRRRSRR